MPTYRNDGANGITVLNTNGELVDLQTGESSITYNFYNITGLTQINETPLFNRVVNRQAIALSGTPQDVLISLETSWILITQITDNVTAYRQLITNIPPEYDAQTQFDPVIQIPAKGTLNKLVMTGTGTCTVTEYIEDLTC